MGHLFCYDETINGGIFDLNRDGKTDATETILGLSIILGSNCDSDADDSFDDGENDSCENNSF